MDAYYAVSATSFRFSARHGCRICSGRYTAAFIRAFAAGFGASLAVCVIKDFADAGAFIADGGAAGAVGG